MDLKLGAMRSMDERLAIPAESDFCEQWTLLAQQNGYKRCRLAKCLGVSDRTLDRHFQKHLALSARHWLAELQLVHAYEQVKSGKPLKAVAYDVGFKQPSHFTRRFKARYGVPPSMIGAASGQIDRAASPTIKSAGCL